MQELEKQLNSDNNIEVRRRAVEQMRGMRDAQCIPLLIKAMTDVSWRVRKSAVDILFGEYSLDQYIGGIIDLLYIEENAGARNSAIEALIKLGRKATPYLIEGFKTSNRDVRKFIIDVLGEEMDSRSLPLILDALKDEDENVRATAVEHLGKAGEVSVVDALIEILDSGDLWTAYPAADALGRIGNRKAVPHLLEAMKRKPLREPVLKALGMLADPATLEPVIALLQDASKNIQEQALRTIEKMYHHGISAEVITEEFRRILGDKATDLLIAHAWSNKNEVRVSAIVMLGLMKDEAAYGPLLDISHEEEYAEDVKGAFVFIGRDRPESLLKLFDSGNPHQLRFIAEVAGEVASPVYYDMFARLLDDDDGHVRSIAARSIARLNKSDAVSMLLTRLADPYEDVQEAAVDALGMLQQYLHLQELLAMLRSDSAVLRRNVARLLGKMKADRAVKELGFALKDEKVAVRKAVVGALSQIGTDEAVRYLKYALTDEDPDIRIAATLSLGAIGGDDILDSLTILTVDPDNFVRVSAARALGMLKDRNSIIILVPLLHDESGFVVTTAIEALKAVGGEEACKAIAGMLASGDDEVKRTAIAALGDFEGVIDLLVPFLRDPDWAARIAAVKALGRHSQTEVRMELEKLLDTEEDPTVVKTVEEILGV
ncbi:MAG: HEAT repeat domain-containing protein [Nitrospirae bacterium]|nr:HEAT repeat domain-containing protein [Nitrospirota bacterium]